MGNWIERNQPRYQGLSAHEWFYVEGKVPEELVRPLLDHHAKLMRAVEEARALASVEDEDPVYTLRRLT
jgi:hypothetical protein